MQFSENKIHNPVTGENYDVEGRLSDDPDIKSLWEEPPGVDGGKGDSVTMVPKYYGCTCGSPMCIVCEEDTQRYNKEHGFFPLRSRFDTAQEALEAGFKERDK